LRRRKPDYTTAWLTAAYPVEKPYLTVAIGPSAAKKYVKAANLGNYLPFSETWLFNETSEECNIDRNAIQWRMVCEVASRLSMKAEETRNIHRRNGGISGGYKTLKLARRRKYPLYRNEEEA